MGYVGDEEFVFRSGFYLEPEGVEYGVDAEVVVPVSVSGEQM
jgi:hypothetical protein